MKHYGSHVKFSGAQGQPKRIYLLQMEKYIMDTQPREESLTFEEEGKKQFQNAALLIKADIRDKMYKQNFYPTAKE